ncbi:ribonuclease Oy [Ischnura elegans]|uniref:ribonuclease Oy n=1 Tax=Ischnura elegans TaxID=197161 RepID=UPI001ED8A15A|nr:ribonuclease Oy [Ischnura elegans]XP_046388789.1 ribonuclease Oy [Ischnura elegans]XP_046388791.1 ribonuclease Oy [Ischnura elegans]XP_046388792.1 ribonuclease Oy [Ischnura elegans]
MWRLFILTIVCSTIATSENSRISTRDWDILIFTQSWPNTVCLQWKEKYENHTCLVPIRKNEWTIHGIWPTIYGTHKPGYCNTTWKFDESKISPIEDELNKYWPNIQNGSSETSLWEHEWEKHGTCAASLPQLDGEMKYFKQGLAWAKKYSLTDMLSSSGINPSDGKYTVQDLVDAIKSSTNKNPAVECMTDKETGEEYLLEIRICFDKKLELIDCDGIEPLQQGLLTNCAPSKEVFYPSNVPPVHKKPPLSDNIIREGNAKKQKISYLDTLLRIITFLQWLTL